MIKRISILGRLDHANRAEFSAHWQDVHGGLVRALPGVRRYIQNHVTADIPGPFASQPFAVDGVVELFFADDAGLQAAFSSPAAKDLLADEPNFLGHGTGYLIAGDRQPSSMPGEGGKIVAVASGDAAGLEALHAMLADCPGALSVERDDVATLIPKPNLAPPPQRVDAFLQARFASPQAAQAAATDLGGVRPPAGIVRLAAFLVREHRVV